MMTPEQAMTGLIAITGSGGVSALGVAFFGYLAAKRQGRPAAEAPTFTINGGPDGASAKASALALSMIASSLCRIAAILEIEADERWDGKDFRDRVDDRMMRFQTDDIKAAAGAYSTENRSSDAFAPR